MKEHYDFSNAVKKPDLAARMKKGYTVIINYGAENAAENKEYEPLPEENTAFEEYRAVNS
jgi:SAM-dependent MidA family methyltransferase